MEIRQLEKRDAPQFSALIVNMYSHLDNLEWFTPMPYDLENVEGMIAHPRFYIIGAFEDGKLVGVSSLDYKCGKLIGKVDFPADCNTEKLVEIGFNLVHFDFRGRKIMQQLIDVLLEKSRRTALSGRLLRYTKTILQATNRALIKALKNGAT